MSNQYAKCEATQCEKYNECARVQSTSTAIVNYYSMCKPEETPFQWFIQGEIMPKIEINLDENGKIIPTL